MQRARHAVEKGGGYGHVREVDRGAEHTKPGCALPTQRPGITGGQHGKASAAPHQTTQKPHKIAGQAWLTEMVLLRRRYERIGIKAAALARTTKSKSMAARLERNLASSGRKSKRPKVAGSSVERNESGVAGSLCS